MDPNAALAEIRTLVNAILMDPEATASSEYLANADRLAELVGGLDEWRMSGGALPTAWAGV